jgi:hypothetical protein
LGVAGSVQATPGIGKIGAISTDTQELKVVFASDQIRVDREQTLFSADFKHLRIDASLMTPLV